MCLIRQNIVFHHKHIPEQYRTLLSTSKPLMCRENLSFCKQVVFSLVEWDCLQRRIQFKFHSSCNCSSYFKIKGFSSYMTNWTKPMVHICAIEAVHEHNWDSSIIIEGVGNWSGHPRLEQLADSGFAGAPTQWTLNLPLGPPLLSKLFLSNSSN